MPFGVAAAAGIGLVGGVLQSSAASKGQDKAIAAQERAAAQQRADLSPWTGTGGLANTQSADLLGLNGPDAATAAMSAYRTSPGYQFQLNEGLRGVDAGAAAKGMLRSGATLKAEQAFGAGLADSDFGTYYNRLFDMSKLGESAAAGVGAGAITTGQGEAKTDQLGGLTQASIYGDTAKSLGNLAIGLGQNPLLMGGGERPFPTVQPINSNAWAATEPYGALQGRGVY